MEKQKSFLDELNNFLEELDKLEPNDTNGYDISKAKLEAKKKYLELFNMVINDAISPKFDYTKNIELANTMIENILKF